ncbi:tRNA lysidine(34) synthetase TilS [Noviherbaspirillum autotrophicum]|uniref:tRNA lysidine(34) synthetase TilS n=1 Tax=Noviherbaspirillum autotrophicum TaxID=709839 RepID=UPI0006938E20|nr:tRNA lysidine(34) synthetase TilS [Noviherbaspirillum autotrophicum]
MTAKHSASLSDAFERALDVILARVSASAESATPSLAVAYSGGLDSSVLLDLAQRYAAARGVILFAFHIHHGISSNADTWQAHCERECMRLGIRFDARRVALSERSRHGLEQAARLGRYAALGELCRHHRVRLLLTAHHLDDQAETILLQLLRGCGVAGMSGMEIVNSAPDLLGDPNLLVARPFLDIARAELERFAAACAIDYVEDESNADPRYARNALRHHVMPELARYFPGYQLRFARSAQHAQSAHRLLDEMAESDLAKCRDGEGVNLDRLKAFSHDRIDNLLRYWLASCGVRMPSTSWLGEMRSQLFEAREDAQLCVSHPDCHIRRHRNKVFVTPRMGQVPPQASSLSFRWQGEDWMDFRDYRGRLHFEPAEDGIDAEWLAAQDLVLGYRRGGEMLKPARNRPTRSLKHHYQALDIPAWERLRLPLVYTVAGQLLFAAGIGLNWRDLQAGDGRRIRMRWEAIDF